MTCRAPWHTAALRPCTSRLLLSPLARPHHHSFIRLSSTDVSPPRNTLLNPPASTRPPPLDLPNRSSFDSAPLYYFNLGKAYIRFYKDGVKAVLANRRLLREKIQRTPVDDRPSILRPYDVPKTFSRADWVLLWRVRHDMLRLPFFGLMLLVIGEFTVLVVALVDGVVPYTCRFPRQVYSSLERAEARRSAAYEDMAVAEADIYGALRPLLTRAMARAHILRSLHLSSALWDKIWIHRVAFPGIWWLKGRPRLEFLAGDDKNLIEDGGLVGLEVEELRIACAERGIDVLGKSEEELRGLLGDWLRLTAAESERERRKRMAVLLISRPEDWPDIRDFALPAYDL